MSDARRGSQRTAIIADGRLAATLFIARDDSLPPRDWLIAQLGEAANAAVLAGRPAGQQVDRGPIVCICFDVGLRTIVSAIAEQALVDVPAIGKALGAGTNCGSCRPALARILAEHPPAKREGIA